MASLVAALALLSHLGSAAAPTPQRGDVVFEADFDQADALEGWEWASAARIVEGRDGSPSLSIGVPAGPGPAGRMVRHPLDVHRMRGCKLHFEAQVKAQDVAEPPKPWNGVKFMLHYLTPAGPRWTQHNNVHGTFDWKPVRFAVYVPDDVTQAWVYLGLEHTTGRAWFDAIRVTVARAPTLPPSARREGPAFKGHHLPRLRGAMVRQKVDEDSLRVFGEEWNANVIRWQLGRHFVPNVRPDPGDLESYDRWLDGALAQMDARLPACEKYGLMVVVDLHFKPGHAVDGQHAMFRERKYQDKFVDVWRKIAARYRGRRVVWGYDLANEPSEGVVADGLLDWQDLAERTAKAIREIDPDTAIIVEAAQGGNPHGFNYLYPIDAPGVVYSVHVYVPHTFTHQGVKGRPSGFTYPGQIDGKHWDKERLRQALEPVVKFQRRYGVHIYVGEFSAIRWAPDHSAYRYLRDCIDLFEEYGWDWTYHAFREWSGWSVEHGEDRETNKPAPEPTDRQKLLTGWFAKNAKPWPASPRP